MLYKIIGVMFDNNNNNESIKMRRQEKEELGIEEVKIRFAEVGLSSDKFENLVATQSILLTYPKGAYRLMKHVMTPDQLLGLESDTQKLFLVSSLDVVSFFTKHAVTLDQLIALGYDSLKELIKNPDLIRGISLLEVNKLKLTKHLLSISISEGQDTILGRIEALGYPKREGVCFGAGEVVKENLLEEKYGLEALFEEILNIPSVNFSLVLDAFNKKRIAQVKQIKRINEKEAKDPDVLASLEKEEAMQSKISELKNIIGENKNLTEIERNLEFESRRRSLLSNTFFQKKIDLAFSEWPKNNKLIMDIPYFLEEMVLYQDISVYGYLFPENNKPKKQSDLANYQYFLPKNLKKEGGIATVKSFIGIYRIVHLINYFNNLNQALENNHYEQPMVMTAQSGDHATLVARVPGCDLLSLANTKINPDTISKLLISNAAYIKVGNERLYFIDKEKKKFISLTVDNNKLHELDAVMKLSETSHKILTFKELAWMEENIPNFIKPQKEWLFFDINHVSKEKSFQRTVYSERIALYMLFGFSRNGTTAFISKFHTTASNSEKLTKALNAWLPQDNNFNGIYQLSTQTITKCDSMGTCLLHLAVKEGNLEQVSILLSLGADPNQAMNNGITALTIAAKFGYFAIVKLLLENKADLNHVKPNSRSPLYFAAQNGHLEIVQLILDNHGDKNSAFNTNCHSLLKFSKNHSAEAQKNIEQLIANKKGSDPISLTPQQIASLMGHGEIEALLREYPQNTMRPS